MTESRELIDFINELIEEEQYSNSEVESDTMQFTNSRKKQTKRSRMTQKERLNKLEEARKQAHNEFVGISNQIDQIFNAMKSWYVFPHLRKRPTIINLWGITGTFKTSVVRRIIELLELNEESREQDARKVKQLGFIGSCLNSEVLDEYREDAMESQPSIFLIDEFQNAKTLGMFGEDVKGSENLSDLFSIYSDGKITQKRSEWTVRAIKMLKKEIIDEEEKFLADHAEKMLKRKVDIENYYQNLIEKTESYSDKEYAQSYAKELIKEKEDKLVKSNDAEVFWNEYTSRLRDIGVTFQMIKGKSIKEIVELLRSKLTNISLDIVYDFSGSLIFNLGNLDEIFGHLTMMLDNESVTPDEFYELTKKVSFNDAKMCLLRLFKPEQVSRLGSTHVIFPSFNSEMYFKLIDRMNKSLIEDAKKEGIKLKIDKSLNRIVFALGAIPSQGARAIISTHETLVKVPVSEVITMCILGKQKSAIIGANSDGDIVIKVGKKTKVLDNMLINRNVVRTVSNFETMVHEAGHAITAIATMGMYPDKITVIESDGALGYVRMNKLYKPERIDRKFFVDRIAVCMAGRVAEEIFFGPESANAGASSDIEQATKLATLAVKVYGLGDSHDTRSGFASMFLPEDATVRSHSDSDNEEVENMVKEGTLLAFNILEKYKKEHRMLSNKLKTKHEMNEQELAKFLRMR